MSGKYFAMWFVKNKTENYQASLHWDENIISVEKKIILKPMYSIANRISFETNYTQDEYNIFNTDSIFISI